MAINPNVDILANGPGSKDRRAALVAAILANKPHGNSDAGKWLASVLADAAARYSVRAERKARKASESEPEPVKADAPVKVERKARGKAANGKAAAPRGRKARKVAETAGTVPCLACFQQVSLADAIAYPEGHVCPSCEAESLE